LFLLFLLFTLYIRAIDDRDCFNVVVFDVIDVVSANIIDSLLK